MEMRKENSAKPAHNGYIFHLMQESEWEAIIDKGVHKPASLASEGFIHCSLREQVLESATKHYTQADILVVAQILVKPVKDILKWEESRGGALFPHLYGPLRVEDVATVRMLSRNSKGAWEWDTE